MSESNAPRRTTFVALMRGINLGKRHRILMKDLRALFEGAGATDVGTYIQSGNVVFRAHSGEVIRIGKTVERRIVEAHGFPSPVVIRSAEEFRKVPKHNPFLTEALDEKTFNVAFLVQAPDPKAVEAIDHERFLPDRLRVVDARAYLYYPNGTHRSRLSVAFLDKALGTIVTLRNWRTVNRLVALVDELDEGKPPQG